ncbi:MAG: hypothetical protein WBP12_04230 [Candidatus Saccharimonas sp.]
MAVKVDDPRDIDGAYQDRFDHSQLKNAENTPSRAYSDAGIDQAEAFANDPANATIQDKEEAGAGDEPSWKLNRDTPSADTGKELSTGEKAIRLAKKGGPSAIIVTLLVGGGSILGSFLGAGSLAVSLAENATSTNDSSSSAMERRFLKFFAYNTNPNNNTLCASSVKSIKCKMGRISNNAIKSLNKKGVIAVVDGAEYDGKRLGYPSKNPDSYKFPDGRGGHVNVAASDLKSFLLDPSNREMASKVLGVRGAFNMRYKAWASNVINKKFYQKFGLKRNGGIADGSGIGGENSTERQKSILAKLRERIPALDKVAGANEFPSKISEKMGGHVKRAGRAGTAYTLAVASCIAIKLPGYIAAGIAAIQLAQILPYAMDTILSPASKQKASAIDSGFTTDDANKVGTLLTEKGANGKAAVDSAIFLAAIGVNKNPPAMSSKYTPGYGVFQSGIVKAAGSASKSSQGACNAIMSPAAMYTAMAVEGAITIAASATIIGGLIKISLGWAISEVATKMASAFGEEAARAALEEVAKNDNIPKAQHEELGDVLGISLTSFFSSGSMARGLPALKETQLGEFQAIKQENENFQREMDLASLSPFDTSSRYTFLGSIVYNAQMAVLSNGGYSTNSLLSAIRGLASLPAMAFSSNAGATDYYNANYCRYADTIGLNTTSDDDPSGANTPAINLAGMPCTGITTQQANMDTERAMQLLSDEGWIDSEKEGIADGATMEEMLSSGYIMDDTPLAEFVKSCTDAGTGEYMAGAAGCTVNSPPQTNINLGPGCLPKYDDSGKPTGEQVCSTDAESELEGVKNPNSLAAMSVFLIDYQIMQATSGEDDPEGSGNGATTGTTMTGTDGSSASSSTASSDTPPAYCTDNSLAPNDIGQAVCKSYQYNEYGYLWGGGHESNPQDFLQKFKANGFAKGTPILDCSGIVRMSILEVTGVDIGGMGTSSYPSSPSFTEVPKDQAKPGDVVWYPGHVELVVSNDSANKKFYTFGAHTENAPIEKQIGPSSYTYDKIGKVLRLKK